ncbi:MAG: hypothetical protein K1W18_02935 [Oscillospiraceae bacterium]
MGKYKLHDIEHDTVLDLELTAEEFGELKRFLKDLKKLPANIDYRFIVEQYSSICKNLLPIQNLTLKRKRIIAQCIKAGFDPIEVFKKAAQSSFLGGKNKEQWHANFDWILEPEHALKILEGNYSPITPAPSAPMTGNPFDEYG